MKFEGVVVIVSIFFEQKQKCASFENHYTTMIWHFIKKIKCLSFFKKIGKN
jgi:hypothetical protein